MASKNKKANSQKENKIIDIHVHKDFSSELTNKASKESEVLNSEIGLQKELSSNNIVHIISIQVFACRSDGDPIAGFNPLEKLEKNSEHCSVLVAVNPTIKNNMNLYEELIKSKKIAGFKIYLGYYHYYPYDSVYTPFYKLAEKYGLIIMFHTGDNYSTKAKVKYAHPLNVDEVAVDYPKVKFILAHLGNPWLDDAAEVVYKNPNVYADLSGLLVGNLDTLGGWNPHKIKDALNYCGYDKIMYGSDWPLVPMGKYIRVIKTLIPKKEQNKVFYENAKKLFNIKD